MWPEKPISERKIAIGRAVCSMNGMRRPSRPRCRSLQVLITATNAYSSAGGSDLAGRNLITAALAVGANGVTVTPMAQHSFAAEFLKTKPLGGRVAAVP